jgi:ribosomal protein L12E/L44/L45/RPP1/RPP2
MIIGATYDRTFTAEQYRADNVYRYYRQDRATGSDDISSGVNIDTARAIDILLAQLKPINHELAMSRQRTEASAVEAAKAAAEALANIRAKAKTAVEEASHKTLAVVSGDAHFNSLLEQYAQFRANARNATEANPYTNADTYAGMLFGIAA